MSDRASHLRFIGSNVTERPAAEFLNNLFEFALHNRISDLHFRINDNGDAGDEDESYVEVRSNGEISIYDSFPIQFGLLIKDLICKKTKIAQSDSHLPHDGRMKLFYSRSVDARVSVIPLTNRAFSIVCRILDSENSLLSIDSFNIDEIKKHVLKEAVVKPEGMILVSGPTGSGKTTTLYTLLNYAYTGKNIVITIENPVEYQNDRYYQIEVNPHLSFSKALTSVLRQDPDLIMVGEIRDSASADTAVKASETGHMLMSTIHALDTISTISRLEGMGINREQVAGVLSAVLAQRLVKSIPDGVEFSWEIPSDIEMEWLKRNGIYFEGILFPKIEKSLMTERIPLMELIEVTSEIREVIAKPGERNMELLQLVAKQPQFETLAQCGVKLALAGKTTLAEVMGVTRDNVSLQPPKRFEQILIERGWLSVSHLNQAWKIYIERQIQGQIYPLDKILFDHGFVSKEQLLEAQSFAQKERVVQDLQEVSRKKLVISANKNVAA
jgi:type II secretory ATPase GspE/PulE/Tfp pilus assembly ATPase PilB-like protein